MPKLSARFQSLPEYPLATIPQKKRELLMRGVDVIDLGAGDADLAPPAAVLDAIASAVHNPTMNRYGFGLGLVAYREAVTAWMKKRFGFTADPLKQIVPLIGSKEGISHLAFDIAHHLLRKTGSLGVNAWDHPLLAIGERVTPDATRRLFALCGLPEPRIEAICARWEERSPTAWWAGSRDYASWLRF